eukprot:Nitzschia sp. Nitz4//scaffold275_size25065//13806//17666//NITZ4_008334-RA/size25065-processed-gene-0.4-mRNA-1//1//CDS//3329545303//790//frame0
MDFVDYYELLGIEPTAAAPAIKKAVKAALIKYHPDKNAKSGDENVIKECTRKTALINRAKEILLNASKRKDYDQQYQDEKNPNSEESKRRRQERQPPPNSGGDYSRGNRGRPLKKAKYTPGATCVPFTGYEHPRVFYFSGDGTPGDDALHGHDGRNGVGFGECGTDGGDATMPEDGKPGADYHIFLSTVQGDEGHLEISVLAAEGNELSSVHDREPEYTPIKSLQSVDFSSRGGRGGNGGIGGDGGNGARGRPGVNATRHSSGSNGGPGGDGGAGGQGTNGGHGGRGGYVTYHLDENDTYLLMKVGGIDPVDGPGERVKGGEGGTKGKHGKGGRGGSGGAGGNSYSWSEPTYYRNSNGYVTTSYTHHSNPGGWSGSGGSNGSRSKTKLEDGNMGSDGQIEIQVNVKGSSTKQVYHRRYDLNFASSTNFKLSDLGKKSLFEFGETVHIKSLLLRNSGHMPTPNQRVILGVGDACNVDFEGQRRILVAQGLSTQAGDTVSAKVGFLTFACPYPEENERDYEPIEKDGWLKYAAIQLGPENEKAPLLRLSDFQAPYTRLHSEVESDELQMTYPKKNKNGIRGMRSLAVGETTFVLLTISNISRQSFGVQSSTGRSVSVLFQYVDAPEYEIQVDQTCVRSENGDIVDVRAGSGDKGFKIDIPFVQAKSDWLAQVSFQVKDDMNGGVRPGARGGLQAKIFLDDIPVLNPDGSSNQREKPSRLIQSRLLEISCQPKFKTEVQADAVIITTTSSDADQIQEWSELLDGLGMSSQIYSLSRYGHMESKKKVEDVSFKNVLKGKTVIILNEKYKPEANDEQHRQHEARPSELFNSPYDFHESTKFLLVGGKVDEVDHLSPSSEHNSLARKDIISIDTSNRKEFKGLLLEDIEEEREIGFATSSRSMPRQYSVEVKSSFIWEPKQERIRRVLNKRCQRMQSWVNKQDNLRYDKVTWHDTEPKMLKKGTLRKLYSIGELQITLGFPSHQKSVVWVSEEGGGRAHLASPGAIKSQSMLHALLSSLHIQKRLDCYVNCLEKLANDVTNEYLSTVVSVSRDCIVCDFLVDISTYYHGRFKVEAPLARSRTLLELSNHEKLGRLIDDVLANTDDPGLKEVIGRELANLVASLRCCATSLDLRPWWNPLSRKFSASKAMREAVTALEVKWVNILVEEKEIQEVQRTIQQEVKMYIKKGRKKFWLRARGRYRAALEHIHAPSNIERYPPHPDIGPTSTRIRDEHTIRSGDSRKRKKCVTKALSPDEVNAVCADSERRVSYAKRVHKTTVQDDAGYRQSIGTKA